MRDAVSPIDHPSSKAFWPAYDDSGNVTALVNASSGAIAAAYEYDPYGNLLRAGALDSVMDDNPFRFSTKYNDHETGLTYYGVRFYSASPGRFINRDPSGEDGGINLYRHCSNNPLTFWDALGLKTQTYSSFGGSSQSFRNMGSTGAGGATWVATSGELHEEQHTIEVSDDSEPPSEPAPQEPYIDPTQYVSTINPDSTEQTSFWEDRAGNIRYEIDLRPPAVDYLFFSDSIKDYNSQYALEAMTGSQVHGNPADGNRSSRGESGGIGPTTGTVLDFAGATGKGASMVLYSQQYGWWLGQDGRFHSTRWGGNGTSAGRSVAERLSGEMEVGGRLFFYAGAAFGAYETVSGVREGRYDRAAFGVLDVQAGILVEFEGPYGWAAGLGWALGRALGNAFLEATAPPPPTLPDLSK